MTKLKLMWYSDERILEELKKSRSICDDLKNALNCIPATSVLGRLGIMASLKRESKIYNDLLCEAEIRKLV